MGRKFSIVKHNTTEIRNDTGALEKLLIANGFDALEIYLTTAPSRNKKVIPCGKNTT